MIPYPQQPPLDPKDVLVEAQKAIEAAQQAMDKAAGVVKQVEKDIPPLPPKR
jgi:hypothetical protein